MLMRMIVLVMGSWFLAACVPVVTPVPVPTAYLTPATATHTPPPLTPSPTAPTLPLAPQDIQPTLDTAAALTPLQTTSVMPDAALIRRIMGDLAATLQIETTLIQLVRVESIVWLPSVPGCALASPLRDTDSRSGYQVILLAGTQVYQYFTVGTDFRRCPMVDVLRDDLLLLVDPVAQDMLALAQRRLAQELDLPQRRIQLMAMQPYVWSDTSLGCPAPDQTYTARPIDGYRIVVSVGETPYAFHTDSERIIPCPAGREKLPTE